MKTTKTIFKTTICMVLLSTLWFTGCKKSTNSTPATTPSPTPTTTTYNLTAKVDGASFNSKDGKGQIYGNILLITAYDVTNANKYMLFNLNYDSLKVTTYQLTKTASTGLTAYGEYDDATAAISYKTDSATVADKITITKFDKTGKKISGTFNFTGIDKNNYSNQKVITNGSFTDLTW